MGTLAQFFCSHIYKINKEEFLRTQSFIIMDKSDIYHPFRKVYDYYATYKTCVKCGKEIIVEERRVQEESQNMILKD